MSRGFKGISFPFRFSPRGGVTTTTTSSTDSTHIKESVTQIIRTQVNERPMESDFGTNSMNLIFEPLSGDTTLLSVIRFNIEKALKTWEKRIKVNSITLAPDPVNSTLQITVTYVIIQTQVADAVTLTMSQSK